jgi:hypothetical protein
MLYESIVRICPFLHSPTPSLFGFPIKESELAV